MIIHITLPGGGELHMERTPREPMNSERFNTLCALMALLIASEAFVRFFALLTR